MGFRQKKMEGGEREDRRIMKILEISKEIFNKGKGKEKPKREKKRILEGGFDFFQRRERREGS